MTEPRNRWLEAIDDIDLLNTLLDADPALRENMAEMGLIRKQPFQLDHNQATTSKYTLTKQGEQEIMERYVYNAGYKGHLYVRH